MAGTEDYIYSEREQEQIEGPFTVRRSKWTRSLAKRAAAARRLVSPQPGRIRERIVEVPLVIAALSNLPKSSRVADVGGASSLLGLQLVYLGLDVQVLDLRAYPLKHPNLSFQQIDLFDNDLPESSFAAISCISVIEHVGIVRYGGSARTDGDCATAGELGRLCRPEGLVLLSAPYGRGHNPDTDGPPVGYRIYDRTRLQQLCAGFEIDALRFFALQQGCWVELDQSAADDIPTSRPIDAIFFAQLRVPN